MSVRTRLGRRVRSARTQLAERVRSVRARLGGRVGSIRTRLGQRVRSVRDARESPLEALPAPSGTDGWARRLVLGGFAVATVLLTLVPLVFLLWTSVWDGYPGQFSGSVTLGNFRAVYLENAFDIGALVGNSLFVAGGTTLISMGVGLAFAWLLVRTNVPTKDAMELVLISPYAVPGYIYAVMYITAYGPDHGLVTSALVGALGLEAPPVDIFSPTGIVVVAGVDAVTSVYLLTAPALQDMDASLEEVARIHGANVLQTVRSVTFPVILPAILTALIVRFLLGLGEFSIVAILGARERYEVYATAIWKAVRLRAPPEYGQAAALSISLLVVAAVLVWYHRKATSRKEDYMTVTGQGYQPHTWDLGKWRWPLAGALWAFMLLVWVLPVVVMVVVSVHSVWGGTVDLSRLTLAHYAEAVTNPRLRGAFVNSVLVSFAGATLGTVLVVGLSYYTERTDYPLRGAVDFLSLSSVAIPGVITGVSVLFTALWVGKVHPLVDLYGTLWIVVIGCVIAYIPMSSRLAIGNIVQIHTELEESARIAGATWVQQMREVFLPLFRNTSAIIWFYLLIHIFQLITIPLMVYSSDTMVVPVKVFNIYMNTANVELVSAISTVFVGLTFLVLLSLRLVGVSFHDMNVE
ncbi:ABC transporter permease subunit [Halosimplex marinum]|uniref:ABC transporter permease n=1 Tax=Halosimplex marinum TaxID=3396620 RepID=UPI003F551BEC